ncbi:Oxidoreductase swnR [Lachnellula suecica]|uniref:Oxidoreductase swnR n=1 Tax=Lachnellula suecica TaxID=602035 RepID=A0A8T9CFV0_9HELO|nr:Oxidoreductase swnR [Lachnellula suecica]
MMRIAIAGSGGLGRMFAQHLNDTVHPFIILSRRDQPALTAQGYQVAIVDYDSQDDLRYTLRGIDLVISTVSGVPQINLIDAAAHSGVQRFIPAEFEGPPARRTANDPLDRGKRATIDRLRHWSHHHRHQMRFTIFSCGIFYERFARGGLAASDIGTLTGIQNEGAYLMNMRLGTAEVVERTTSGQTIYICLTSIHDLGRFFIASLGLGLQNWPAEFRMYGERMSVTQLLQWAAAVRGSKTYDPDPTDVKLTYIVEMFSTDVIEPQDLAAHLQHATYYHDYPKMARIQELIATEQRRYDFAAPNLNTLVAVQPVSFWDWLSAEWGVAPAQ